MSEREGRLEAILTADELIKTETEAEIRLGFSVDVEARSQSGFSEWIESESEEAIRERYLSWPIPFPSSGPALEREAERIRSMRGAEERMMASARMMLGSIRVGHLYYDEIPAGGPFEVAAQGGWIDCFFASCALTQLLRNVGIPARIIGGVLLERFAPMTHYWVEARLPGRWAPIDMYCWDLGNGDRREEPWAECLVGTLDPRVRLEEIPCRPSGPLGSVFPSTWMMRRRRVGERGVGIGIYERRRTDTGWTVADEPNIEDVLTIERLERADEEKER